MCQKKIMRKRSHESFEEGPPRKKLSREEYVAPKKVAYGEILTDLTGKKWKVGKAIGHGGFGDIYLVTDQLQASVKQNAPYVVKIESHSNGPLFVEINCFIRIAKSQMIEKWRQANKIDHIGMPHYVASGSHKIGEDKLRFLILPHYDMDLEKILNKHSNKFNLKTAANIGIQIIDSLEYIHNHGFVHCDIKASNILYCGKRTGRTDDIPELRIEERSPLGRRREHHLRQCTQPKRLFHTHSKQLRNKKSVNYNENYNDDLFEEYFDEKFDKFAYQKYESEKHSNQEGKVYLMDYGLATKFIDSNGQHRQYCNDERKAHAGTLMFCSLDAHLGTQSRRSDLECLGYNMIYWLTGKLPWEHVMDSPECVEREKKKNFQDLEKMFKYCFGGSDYPNFIYEYFYHIRKLTFEEQPNYEIFKTILRSSLVEYCYKIDNKLDFENTEGWGHKQKLSKKLSKYEIVSHKNSTSPFIQRQPLVSNSPIIKKPVLRGKKSKSKKKKMNWSKILSSDPEKLFKNRLLKEEVRPGSRDRRYTDPCEMPLHNLDIFKMNPTYAMMDIYNRCRDRQNGNYQNTSSKAGRGDSYIADNLVGYTPAMNLVLIKVRERKLSEQLTMMNNNGNMKKTRAVKSTLAKKNDHSVKRVQSTQVASERVKEKESRKLKPNRMVRRHGLRG